MKIEAVNLTRAGHIHFAMCVIDALHSHTAYEPEECAEIASRILNRIEFALGEHHKEFINVEFDPWSVPVIEIAAPGRRSEETDVKIKAVSFTGAGYIHVAMCVIDTLRAQPTYEDEECATIAEEVMNGIERGLSKHHKQYVIVEFDPWSVPCFENLTRDEKDASMIENQT